MKKVKLFLLLILSCLFISSCMSSDTKIKLPGKILVSTTNEPDKYVIYSNSDMPTMTFEERQYDSIKYSLSSWLYTNDSFIGTESITGSTDMEYRCNIVRFNISGKLVDCIYKAKKGEIAWPLYPSWDDKYLIFTTHKLLDPGLYPFEGLTPMVSLVVMDLDKKQIIQEVDSIGRDPNFTVEESPWLHDGYRFVYSISSLPMFKMKSSEEVVNLIKTQEGVYLYDLSSGERKLLVPGGKDAVASPTSNQIAYEKNNAIRVLDLNTHKERTIYKFSSGTNIQCKHWSPNGKYLYFTYTYYLGIGHIRHSGEKLVNVSTGKEVSFKSISMGFNYFSWK